MFWEKEDEESFRPKEKESNEVEVDESKIDDIVIRLDSITKQVNMISQYLTNISQRVSKAIDASVAYQRDIDDLERRINLVKSRMEELENIVPEVELGDKLGKKAA
jgi:flagellar biosynthesis chaperone FliJ